MSLPNNFSNIIGTLTFAIALCLLSIASLFLLTFFKKKCHFKKILFIPKKPNKKDTISHPSLPKKIKKININYTQLGRAVVAQDPAFAAKIVKKWLAGK